MNLCGKNILITGAGGFIGSHLTEALTQEGCNARAFFFITLLILGDGWIAFQRKH